MTASSLASVSLEPPLVSVCVDRQADMHDLIVAAPRVRGERPRERARRSSRAGSPTSMTTVSTGMGYHSAPTARSCSTARWRTSSASRIATYPGGDHTIVVGRVIGGVDRRRPPAALLSRRLRRARLTMPGRLRSAPSAPSCSTIRRPIPRMVAESLRNIARANRWFGGAAAVRLRPATSRSRGVPRGTTAHPARPRHRPGRPAARARSLGRTPRACGSCRWAWSGAAVAARAGAGGRRAVRGRVRGRAARSRTRAVDIVLVSQVAHHSTPTSAVRLFRACDRLARRAVIVADLRRGPLGPLGLLGGRARRSGSTR